MKKKEKKEKTHTEIVERSKWWFLLFHPFINQNFDFHCLTPVSDFGYPHPARYAGADSTDGGTHIRVASTTNTHIHSEENTPMHRKNENDNEHRLQNG